MKSDITLRTEHLVPAAYQRNRPDTFIRPQSAAKSHASQLEAILFCMILTAGGLASTAQLGGLRLADLVITAFVMATVLVLAFRDSHHLTAMIVATWIFSPLIRRLVDWQQGGFTSLTAISVLPIIVTSALPISFWPRIKTLPAGLKQPLMMMTLPILAAAVMGFFRYGPSAAVETLSWLLPLLFVPYFAIRPTSAKECWGILRVLVLISAVSALYGIYQFMVMPPWDALWLNQSGMLSSMGTAEAQGCRIWGTLNATGPAAVAWALAIVVAFGDKNWRFISRVSAIAIMIVGLLLTFVRIGWIVAVCGIIASALLSRGQDRVKAASLAVLIGFAVWFGAPYLPGGDVIGNRVHTFVDLQEDGSFQGRVSIAQSIFDEVLEEPLGLGVGFKTAGKLAGNASGILSVDNGYLDILITLGPLGGALYFLGIVSLVTFAVKHSVHSGNKHVQFVWIAISLLIMIVLSNSAAFSFGGINGVWLWVAIGISVAPFSTGIQHLTGGPKQFTRLAEISAALPLI